MAISKWLQMAISQIRGKKNQRSAVSQTEIDRDWTPKLRKKGLRQPFDSTVEWHLDFCLQQNLYGGVGSG
jgi:hypothetical protein